MGIASMWGKTKAVMGKASVVGLLTGGAVMAPMVIASIRSSRSTENEPLPPSPMLTAPVPPVLEYVPPAPMDTQKNISGGQEEAPTFINGKQVMGGVSRSVLSRQAGMNAGIDPTNPNLIRPDGTNAVDGSRKMVDLAVRSQGSREL